MMGLKDYMYYLELCSRCSTCKWVPAPMLKSWRFAKICPANIYYAWDCNSGQGLLNIAYKLARDELDWNTKGLPEILYACTLCGACDVICKLVQDIEVLDILLELRAEAVDHGIGPLPAHKRFVEWAEKHAISREKLRVPNDVKISKDADTVYFVGCATYHFKPEIAEATMRILNAADVDFTLLSLERCCGGPLYRIGQVDQFKLFMERNVEALREIGVKKVLTSCAHCYETLKVEYPKFLRKEHGIQVLHTAELVNQLIKEGRLRFHRKVSMKVTYHDPCYLGRNSEPYIPWEGVVKKYGIREPPKVWRRGTNGVYDAPREVLKAIPGVELREMERIREYAFCCGGGGGVREAFPDLATFAAGERVDEAKATGADAIVSCCPFCAQNFMETIERRKNSVAFYDLAQLVYKAVK
ncbi:MAG: (Fe-S)-binding protein [Candidatus Bathyarchaeia archaeon]